MNPSDRAKNDRKFAAAIATIAIIIGAGFICMFGCSCMTQTIKVTASGNAKVQIDAGQEKPVEVRTANADAVAGDSALDKIPAGQSEIIREDAILPPQSEIIREDAILPEMNGK